MNPNKRSTIYDVADYAGVAISTVSRVLNNSPEVSDGTRKRILSAIETLQFRPDRTAKMLATSGASSLSIAVPSFTSMFYNEMLKGVKDTVADAHLDLLLCNLGSADPASLLMEFLERGRVDALLVVSIPIDEKLHHELKMLNAPVVIVGAEVEGFDCFYWDAKAASQLAVEHLVSIGHRHIAMLGAHSTNLDAALKVDGYRNALENAGLPYDPDFVVLGDTDKHSGQSEEAGYESMNILLKRSKPLTAVFAASDVQAIGAMLAIREAGLRVPNDIAVVGFDDIKVSRFIGLSSIDQDMYTIGKKASETVLARIGDRTSPRIKTFVSPELKIRSSSLSR